MTEHFGIWNAVDRRFVFGIDEPTPKAAERRFREVCGSPLWRYSVRRIPPGWKNPRNPMYIEVD